MQYGFSEQNTYKYNRENDIGIIRRHQLVYKYLGLTEIEHWLDKHRESLPRPFPKEFILEAISIVLKENTFQFDDINYKQIQGTEMGTKMAPTYATLTMGFIETQLYERFKEKYGQDEKENFVKLFKRFLDDCFLPWKEDRSRTRGTS
jgi:hypothetical protein